MTVQYKKIDDTELSRLATEPSRSLFGVLDHADAMFPLVILLACLPTLYAVAYRPLTDDCALWGLKALKTAAAVNAGQFADPGSVDASVPFRWKPPLISWLAALSVRGLGAWTDSAVIVAAYLATSSLIALTFFLARPLGGAKLGLLTVVILAFHSDILAMAQIPSPVSVSLCFALITLWAFLEHLRKSQTFLSANLLVSGIAFGLCLLAAGPFALVVLVTLFLFLLVGVPRKTPPSSQQIREHRGGHLDSPFAFLSLAMMALTGFAVGGWWELMMSHSYGMPFWRAWLTGQDPLAAVLPSHLPTGLDALFMMPRRLGRLLMVIAGPAVYGLWRAIREIRRSEDPALRQALSFLIVWVATAGVMWGMSQTLDAFAAVGENIWRGYLLLPLSILAAWGVLQIVERRVNITAIAGIALMTAANLVWNAQRNPSATGLPQLLVLLVIIGGLAVCASVGAEFSAESPPGRRGPRLLTRLLLVVLAASHCIWSMATIRTTNDADRELAAIRHVLSGIDRKVLDFTIISSDEKTVPPQLEFLARSVWPWASGETVQSWDAAAVAQDLGSTPTRAPTDEQESAHVFLMWHASQSAYPVVHRNLEIVRFDEYFRHRQLAILVLPATNF